MSCYYSQYPNIKFLPKSIKWFCNIADNTQEYNCLSYAYDYRGDITQINPKPQVIDQVGVVDSFVSNNGLVSIDFSPDLVPNTNYTFSVICNGDNKTAEYNATITPVFEDLTGKAVAVASYGTNNFWAPALMVFVLAVLISILIGLAIYFYRVFTT